MSTKLQDAIRQARTVAGLLEAGLLQEARQAIAKEQTRAALLEVYNQERRTGKPHPQAEICGLILRALGRVYAHPERCQAAGLRELIGILAADTAPPDDPDKGMVQMSKLAWPPDLAKRRERLGFLDANGIEHRQKGQRRMVNAAQFAEAVAKRNKRAFEGLDDPESLFPAEIPPETFASEARQGKDTIRQGWTAAEAEEAHKRARRKR